VRGDDIDNTRLPGRREHAGRSRNGDPLGPRRQRCPGQARLDPAVESGEDERRGKTGARYGVTSRSNSDGWSTSLTPFHDRQTLFYLGGVDACPLAPAW